jgi:hypothetical protein
MLEAESRTVMAIEKLGNYNQEFSDIEKLLDDKPEVKRRLFALCERIDDAVDILEGKS